MKTLKIITVLLLLCLTTSAQIPDPQQFYPLDLPLIASGDNVQEELDTHKKIRLQATGYGQGITVRSGYEVYGLPGTKLTHIIVEGGTSQAVVAGIHAGIMVFKPSELIKDNLIINIRSDAAFKIENAKLENNRFVDTFGKYLAEMDQSGYMRDNQFIRCTVHSSFPQLSLTGNDTNESYGNTFLWFNFLSGHEDNAVIRNFRDLTIAGVDAEMYSNGFTLFDVKETENLTVVGIAGGDNKPDNVPLVDLDVSKTLVYGFHMNTRDTADLFTVNGNSLAMINTNDYKMDVSANYAKVFKGGSSAYNSKQISDLSQSELSSFESAISFPSGVPWHFYEHDQSISARSSQAGSEVDLQSLIDTQGTVFLEERVYLISETLELEPGQALIGRGKGKTILRATDDIVMIRNQYRSNGNVIYRPKFNVAQLTLENGHTGIEFSIDEDGGRDLLMTDIYLSSVEFYNMSYAGVHINSKNCEATALDNNMINHADFIRCKFGVKQTMECECTQWPCPYIDKTAFYRCRFIENEVAADMTAKRQNNNNGFIECLFKDSQTTDITASRNANTLVALCRFESPTSDVMLYAFRPLVIASKINSGKAGAKIFPAFCQVYESEISGNNAKLFDEGKWEHILANSVITGSYTLGSFADGVLYNNSFEGDASLSKKLIQFNDGQRTTLIDKVSSPAPAILITDAEYGQPDPVDPDPTDPDPDPDPDPVDPDPNPVDSISGQIDSIRVTQSDGKTILEGLLNIEYFQEQQEIKIDSVAVFINGKRVTFK